jgi:hypothetical protein
MRSSRRAHPSPIRTHETAVGGWFVRSRAIWALDIAGGPLRYHARPRLVPCPRAPAGTPSTPRGAPRSPHRPRQPRGRGRTGACPQPQAPRGPGAPRRRTRHLQVNRPALYPVSHQASQHAPPTAAKGSRQLVHQPRDPPAPRPRSARGAWPAWPQYARVHVHCRLHHSVHFDLPVLPRRSIDSVWPRHRLHVLPHQAVPRRRGAGALSTAYPAVSGGAAANSRWSARVRAGASCTSRQMYANCWTCNPACALRRTPDSGGSAAPHPVAPISYVFWDGGW